jgi:hypothetical protein
MDDTEAQRILSEFYGVIVDESSAKLEIAALVGTCGRHARSRAAGAL